MEFRKVLTLRGPNVWARFPVLEVWVDLKELKDSPSDSLPGFNERLMAWLPTMIEHRCSVGTRGGFFERLRRGTYQAHILEHVTLELQSLAGHPVGYGRARETSEEGVYKVAIEYDEEELGIACLHAARELCHAAVHDLPYDVKAELAKLRALANEVCLGPSTRAIVNAARVRRIPVRRLNRESLVQLGHGARARRILAAETDETSAIAESIAQDKDLTKTLLRSVGVPVPEGRAVKSADDAWEAALEIGVPVVVKPRYGNQGRCVATNLVQRDQVVAAYENAAKEFSNIMVEKWASGEDHRLLVVGGKVVAASRRVPPRVVGDGVRTVRQLVDLVNQDPRRGDDHANALTKIALDPIALAVLAEQGLEPDSVPAEGRVVAIRRNANLSTGGTAVDVTDNVHPELAARAVEAAQVIGLDIAGVDIVAPEISQPGGVVVEVNAGPGLRMHVDPSIGTPRPVGEAIVESLFPNNQSGRIPIVGVTGTNGKTTTTRLIARLVKETGRIVGMTSTDGIYIDGRRIDNGDCSGPQSAKAVLLNPKVDAAVFEIARGGILREGIGFDHCDVAVVTNIGAADHLGLAWIETPEQMAVIKRCVVETVTENGWAVLKADDPLVAGMAEYCKGSIVYFARDPDHPVIVAHRAAGGRAVFARGGRIVFALGNEETPLMELAQVPLTLGGKVGFAVENALAAVAAGWVLGIDHDVLRGALEAFQPDFDMVPGRFNVLEYKGSTVVLDYGHNVSALEALVEAIGSFPHAQRTIVYSAAGDRRDEDMIRQGQILGASFDRVILFEDHYRRGREVGEIMARFQEGLARGTRVCQTIGIHGAVKAMQAALDLAGPGHLIVIQGDEIDESVAFMRKVVESHLLVPVA